MPDDRIATVRPVEEHEATGKVAAIFARHQADQEHRLRARALAHDRDQSHAARGRMGHFEDAHASRGGRAAVTA